MLPHPPGETSRAEKQKQTRDNDGKAHVDGKVWDKQNNDIRYADLSLPFRLLDDSLLISSGVYESLFRKRRKNNKGR